MSEAFLKVVNMSISAGWLVLAVLVLRLLLKKAPKWIHVLLWGIVAIRLICPFTIESALSLIPNTETISPEIMLDWTPEISTGIAPLDRVVNPVITTSFAPDPATSANPLQILIPVAANLWILGILTMLAYTTVSYWSLRRKVATAIPLRGNLYQCETVKTPFVLGIFRPRIYLPFSMKGGELRYVMAHEQAHILRKDHWWKPLGFLLLMVYWFNPLMWVSYILLCRDIELACDEKVIAKLGNEQRADYTQALVACAVNRRMIAACPLAFGEVGVKKRVRSVMNYKKPTFWIIVTALVVCMVVAVCFLTDPKDRSEANLSEIAITEPLDLEASSGVGVEIAFESEDMLIFYGDFGLFGYDLNTSVVTFSVDFVKAVGIKGSVQGSYGTAVEVSGDGNTIIISEYDAEREIRGKTCYIHIPSLTYEHGEYQPLENVFRQEDIKGYVYPGVKISQIKYIRDGREWNLLGQSTAEQGSILQAKLLEIRDGYFLVEPVEGSWELNSASKIEVPMRNMAPSPEPQLGDILEIEYDGQLQETYPARISTVYHIRVAQEVKAEFEVNFAGNTSLQMRMELTEETPYWWIGVDNQGTENLVVEVGGEVHKITPETYVLYSEEKWEPKMYMVSFASTGASGMVGSAVCYKYKYRLEITGRLNNAVNDITYVVLSNLENITFEQMWKASGLSSNLDDYFDPADAVIVGVL